MEKICLFVTSSQPFELIDSFLESVERQSPHLYIDVVFVNQNKNNYTGHKYRRDGELKIIEVNEVIPLSKARNIAISNACLSNYNFIAFPDDDCWYSDGLLDNIVKFFRKNQGIDILCANVLDPSNNKTYGDRPRDSRILISENNIFKYPISVGIFIRMSDLINSQIYFDEQLGAGTKIGSGEETELIYRLLKKQFRCLYDGGIYVYHPVVDGKYCSNDIKKYFAYGVGFGFLCRKMICNKDFSVLIYYMYILVRTLGGVLLNFDNNINRKVYISRFKGMLVGILRR
ncbi:glycosyltransferase [Vibrio fluvialis]|uniref:glycosyltransferase family 2 protein n=1 Tax=Vibrio fluvialis TaxID=676 RepID=UPI001EEAE57E|nr:glycosyltransferase family 2 protein [Vibrio fluvialis]MCG6405526.1 glycosyltransferase [Vibrio fluvialis]